MGFILDNGFTSKNDAKVKTPTLDAKGKTPQRASPSVYRGSLRATT